MDDTGSGSGHQALIIPKRWEEAADAVASDSPLPPIAVVCGPGNTGKSTFSRILLNTLLKRYKKVCYLDTDVGQPEFTPPGFISLHVVDKITPDLTILYMKEPEKCFFYGDVNCRKDADLYLNSILTLYDYFCHEHYKLKHTYEPSQKMLPLVVNTSGWVKGYGYELLVKMLKYITPTHVIQMRVSTESKNLPKGIFWFDEIPDEAPILIEIKGIFCFDEIPNEAPILIEICCAQKDSSSKLVSNKKDAKMMRDLRIIAYFRKCLPKETDFTSYKQLADGLASIKPNKISISKLKETSIIDGDYLNETIVGLGISSEISSSDRKTPFCIGLGLVRNINVSKDSISIITPVPVCVLEKVDIIQQSCTEVPECLLLQKVEVDARRLEVQISKTVKQFSDLLSIC